MPEPQLQLAVCGDSFEHPNPPFQYYCTSNSNLTTLVLLENICLLFEDENFFLVLIRPDFMDQKKVTDKLFSLIMTTNPLLWDNSKKQI